MTRYEALMGEINKNIKVDESKETAIQGWSPNNVRRLVISHNIAIVQYHVTNSNYRNKIETVDFRGLLEGDVKQINEAPNKYKSILKVLTDGRVCSSIEEIYFMMDNMPMQVYSKDCDLHVLGGDLESVKRRFPRLSHISQVYGVSASQFAQVLSETESEYTLALSGLVKRGIQPKYVAEVTRGEWWKGYNLRSKYYTIDTDTLRVVFERVQAAYSKKEEQSLQANKDKEDIKQFIGEVLPKLMRKVGHHAYIDTACKGVFDNISIISRAEWGKTFYSDNMYKQARRELKKDEEVIRSARSIDFAKVGQILQEVSPQHVAEYGVMDKYVNEVLFEKYLPHVEPYKRESNKSTIKQSLRDLESIVNDLIVIQHKGVYGAFAKYLNRNTPKNAGFYYNLLTYHPEVIRYTRPISEYCNQYLDKGVSAEVFQAIGMELVVVEEFKPSVMMEDTKEIVSALMTAE